MEERAAKQVSPTWPRPHREQMNTVLTLPMKIEPVKIKHHGISIRIQKTLLQPYPNNATWHNSTWPFVLQGKQVGSRLVAASVNGSPHPDERKGQAALQDTTSWLKTFLVAVFWVLAETIFVKPSSRRHEVCGCQLQLLTLDSLAMFL